jgi:hypothetical protein
MVKFGSLKGSNCCDWQHFLWSEIFTKRNEEQSPRHYGGQNRKGNGPLNGTT